MSPSRQLSTVCPRGDKRQALLTEPRSILISKRGHPLRTFIIHLKAARWSSSNRSPRCKIFPEMYPAKWRNANPNNLLPQRMRYSNAAPPPTPAKSVSRLAGGQWNPEGSAYQVAHHSDLLEKEKSFLKSPLCPC